MRKTQASNMHERMGALTSEIVMEYTSTLPCSIIHMTAEFKGQDEPRNNSEWQLCEVFIWSIACFALFRGGELEGLLNFLDADVIQLWLWKLNLGLTCEIYQLFTSCAICRDMLLAQIKSPVLLVFPFQWRWLNTPFFDKQFKLHSSIHWKMWRIFLCDMQSKYIRETHLHTYTEM